MSTIYDQHQPQTYPRQQRSSSCLMIGIPIGCLGILLLACAGVVGTGYLGLNFVMNETAPIVESASIVKEDPRAKAILGEPINMGTNVSTSINYNNGEHTSTVTYDVYGPDGSGKVTANATQVGEEWIFNELSLVEDETGEMIDLLEDVLDAAERESEIQLDDE